MGPLLVCAIAVTGLSGLPGLFFPAASRSGERLTAALLAVGCLLGLASASLAVATGAGWSASASWAVPGGALELKVDGLSAAFLFPIFVLSLAGSTYALGYWRHADHPRSGRALRAFWGGLTAALALVVTAQNTLLFLVAWELMALLNFFAVVAEDKDAAVRRAGYLYLVAMHASALALFAFFAVLHAQTGSFSWSAVALDAASPAGAALFLLALVGFGLKAGILPLHFWLPPTHAGAPTHVSALMSGVVIKMGIYGLIRASGLVAHPPLWWGATVLGLGIASGVLGVAYALGQHDLKRLLAYHSVENIGIICMGLGLALLGRGADRPWLVALGLAGALFHVWNHGLFKALLFLGAGSAIHAVGTREMDRLGGLARKMPSTALLFVLAAAAICGLPPLNGFASEFLVYTGLFHSVTDPAGAVWLAGALGAPALALIGALAVACFVKVYGVVFLGEARSEAATHAHESGGSMLAPMTGLAGACLVLGVAPAAAAPLWDRIAREWAPSVAAPAVASASALGAVGTGALALLAALGVVGLWLWLRTRAADNGPVGTWDCGYAGGSPRVQYTASSFADSLVRLFGWALRPQQKAPTLTAAFPGRSAFHSHTPDAVLDLGLVPVADATGRAFTWLRWIQHGSVHLYVVYILATLLVLMLWH